jgi:hypothetical protein
MHQKNPSENALDLHQNPLQVPFFFFLLFSLNKQENFVLVLKIGSSSESESSDSEEDKKKKKKKSKKSKKEKKQKDKVTKFGFVVK